MCFFFTLTSIKLPKKKSNSDELPKSKSVECSNFCIAGVLFCFPNFQKDNLQFVKGPSVQGLKKPQVRGRGLKIGEGRDKRQSEEEEKCKHCKEVTAVKSTPESILLPTFKEGQAQHGRSGAQTDQYGLLKALNPGSNPILHSLGKEKFLFVSSAD